jgi:HPt (histidine-containing phosphotransfer) domain-containing protein
MDEFVSKPATLDDLAGAIREVLHGRHAPSVTRDTPAPPDDPSRRHVPDGAVVDRAVLDQLADELGDGRIVEQLVTTFLDELDDRVAAIDSSEDGSGDATARRAAHTLQSSARLLGVTALADACLEVEHGATARTPVADLAARARAQLAVWLDDQHR